MFDEFLSLTTLIGIAHSGVRLATPYLYAATGEMFGQRSGVLNLGVEGVMLMGAFAAYYAVFLGGDPWLGVLAALVVGALMGLLMALISVTMQAEQGISGIGLSLFGLGLSSLLLKALVGSPVSIEGFPVWEIPFFRQIPVVGPIFFDHDILVYIAYLLVPVSMYLLYRTTFGLKIRAVGQNPQAADSLGVRVNAVRYGTVIFGSALAGLAGASLSIGLLNIFQENMTNGIGYIAVALVYFGGWRPVGVLIGALLFSTVNAFQLWMQVLGVGIPSDLAVMLPYILTIIVLALGVKQVRQPAALTKPYERGE
jgi:simple sugar transport system permease protein